MESESGLKFFPSVPIKTVRIVAKKANLSKGWDAKPPVPFLRDSGVAQLVKNSILKPIRS